MKKMTIEKIVEISKGNLVNGSREAEYSGFSIDSRNIKKNELFIVIDSEKYISEAFEKGAAGCITQDEIKKEIKEKYPDKVIIKVENVIKALQDIAQYKIQQYSIPIVAITGSVGKTSTKDMVANVMNQKYKTLKTEGNYNNHIGLPLTILKLEDHEAIVLEMGMNHLGEIRRLTQIARPTIAVITNIGTSHIGILGSRENILKAKLEILEGMNDNGILVINNDNDLLNEWNKKVRRNNVITYSLEKESIYKPYDIQILEQGSTYKIKIKEKEYRIEVPISGRHFIENSLCAISIGQLLEIEMPQIMKGIKTFQLSKKRMEIEQINQITIINDFYNASYDSVKPALEYLSIIKGNKKIAVLGDMLELGEYSKELHRKVGEEVIKNKIDILITVGEYSKYIAEATKESNKTTIIYICKNNQEAIKKIREITKENDVILLKASNGMKFNEILEGIR